MSQTLPGTGQDHIRHVPSRVLITRLSAHGDVIHTLPLVTALKKQHPDMVIGWLVEESAAGLLEGHPLIDVLHVSRQKRWCQQLKNPMRWREVCRHFSSLLAEIKAQQYEVSCDVQGLLKSAIWPWLANIPVRYGFRATREFADFFYTDCLPPMNIRDARISAVERYLDFARALGCESDISPQFVTPAPDFSFKSPVLQQCWKQLCGWKEQKAFIVGLAPFTRWESKHWPMAYWQQLIQMLLQADETICLVLFGGPDNLQETQSLLSGVEQSVLATGNRFCNLVGHSEWKDLYAIFPLVNVLVGPDSAPLHIADAVGTSRIVGLYGPTASGRTGPVNLSHHILETQLSCQPCFSRRCLIESQDCMTLLTPDKVFSIISGWLNAQKSLVET